MLQMRQPGDDDSRLLLSGPNSLRDRSTRPPPSTSLSYDHLTIQLADQAAQFQNEGKSSSFSN